MPTVLADGGVSEIATGDHAAMAVKDGRFYIGVEISMDYQCEAHQFQKQSLMVKFYT